jgi:hypothetical protein
MKMLLVLIAIFVLMSPLETVAAVGGTVQPGVVVLVADRDSALTGTPVRFEGELPRGILSAAIEPGQVWGDFEIIEVRRTRCSGPEGCIAIEARTFALDAAQLPPLPFAGPEGTVHSRALIVPVISVVPPGTEELQGLFQAPKTVRRLLLVILGGLVALAFGLMGNPWRRRTAGGFPADVGEPARNRLDRCLARLERDPSDALLEELAIVFPEAIADRHRIQPRTTPAGLMAELEERIDSGEHAALYGFFRRLDLLRFGPGSPAETEIAWLVIQARSMAGTRAEGAGREVVS